MGWEAYFAMELVLSLLSPQARYFMLIIFTPLFDIFVSLAT